MTTSAKASQVTRGSVINPNPVMKISQSVRMTVVNPNIPIKVSQICRLTIVQAPQPETLYCWAQQTNFTSVVAVTPAISIGVS
jgi:hypothetical protein